MQTFPSALKDWRRIRRLSQLDLATTAGVSTRHLAFLETGRARPSRDMLLHLAGVLDVPRAARNRLLHLAGFAPVYPALPLDDASLAPLRAAMDWTITRHAPYPALIIDGLWRLIALNAPATRLFAPMGLGPGDSLLDAICAPDGPTDLITNWPEVGLHTMTRLRSESAAAGGIAALDRAADHLARDPRIMGWQAPVELPAILPTNYAAKGLHLSLFSTYATFGSANEIGVRDLKIELMFPADEATRATLIALSAGAS
jgi:transcriptional regulator with XRE-family HTH domain